MSLLYLIVFVTALWVGFDAHAAGRTRGEVISWALGTVLIWVIVFPWYLVDRRHFTKAATPTTPAASKTLDV
ncbi:MAG: hypothetical protein WAL35_03160 [Acidimicrobiales bacterium]